MTHKRIWVLGAAAAAAVVATGAGAAVAAGGDDAEAPIEGAALDKASQAALAHTGGGRVTETEVDADDGNEAEVGEKDGYYEVEVTRDDGSHVEVELDRRFQVVSEESDDDGGEESEGNDD